MRATAIIGALCALLAATVAANADCGADYVFMRDAGWHIIASPMVGTSDWDDVTIQVDGGGWDTWSAAVANGDVACQMSRYDHNTSSYQTFGNPSGACMAAETTTVCGSAYWFLTEVDNVELDWQSTVDQSCCEDCVELPDAGWYMISSPMERSVAVWWWDASPEDNWVQIKIAYNYWSWWGAVGLGSIQCVMNGYDPTTQGYYLYGITDQGWGGCSEARVDMSTCSHGYWVYTFDDNMAVYWYDPLP